VTPDSSEEATTHRLEQTENSNYLSFAVKDFNFIIHAFNDPKIKFYDLGSGLAPIVE
jgi:hypothetical protein